MDIKQEILKSLEPLLEKAEKENLWFHSTTQDTWLSPHELRVCNAKGQFLWGVDNWTLRDPKEKLHEFNVTKMVLTDAIRSFSERIKNNDKFRQAIPSSNNTFSTPELVAKTPKDIDELIKSAIAYQYNMVHMGVESFDYNVDNINGSYVMTIKPVFKEETTKPYPVGTVVDLVLWNDGDMNVVARHAISHVEIDDDGTIYYRFSKLLGRYEHSRILCVYNKED